MFVKICGLSSKEHIESAIAAGADAVGFVFADSVRKVDPVHAAAVSASVPADVKKAYRLMNEQALADGLQSGRLGGVAPEQRDALVKLFGSLDRELAQFDRRAHAVRRRPTPLPGLDRLPGGDRAQLNKGRGPQCGPRFHWIRD